MHCKHCNTELKEGVLNCPICGAPVETGVTYGEEVVQELEQRIQGWKKLTIEMICVCVVAALSFGLMGYMWYQARQTVKEENEVIAELQEKVAEVNSANDNLQKKIETLESEGESLKEQNETLTSEKASLEERNSSIESDNTSWQNDYAALEEVYNAEVAEVERLAGFEQYYNTYGGLVHFVNENLVFVGKDGKKYHKYGCEKLDLTGDYKVMTVAKAGKYTACKTCMTE